MSFYERRILPHVINLAMNTKELKEERTRCLRDVKGVVLEIGFGTGLNLPYYPPTKPQVEHWQHRLNSINQDGWADAI